MFRADELSPGRQRLLSFAPRVIPFRLARSALFRLYPPQSAREVYLSSMVLEVLWLNTWHLKHCFIHQGVERLDPQETYIFSSLHFGHWGMYPASLFQQHGIASQMVATGRNQDRTTNRGHFWYQYGHQRQHLSGHPCCYSTDGAFAHVRKLKSGISLTVVPDAREQGIYLKELPVNLNGAPFYLQRSVATLARRSGVRIVPYIGYYDAGSRKHRVQWSEPISPDPDDQKTLQRMMDCWEPVFSARAHNYFRPLDGRRVPMRRAKKPENRVR